MEAALRLATEALDRQRVRFALIGGLAVSARAEPRFTRDVDLAVSVSSDTAAEGLTRELLAAGWQVLAQIEQVGTGRLATVRLAPPAEHSEGGTVVDLLFASSGIEASIVAAAEPIEVFPTLVVPLATVGHLLALKTLAHDAKTRPQDGIDLRSLLAVASARDLAVAREALTRIQDSGFARDKNLLAEFDEFVGD